MPSKIQRKRKTKQSRGLEADTEAIRILRTVRDEEAFYFYETVGKPTGESARSLSEFLEKIKNVKLESLLFHLQRKDFQNWIENTLGDSKLARRVGRIIPSCSEDLKIKIHSTIENRIKELREASITLMVNEDLTIASSVSAS